MTKFELKPGDEIVVLKSNGEIIMKDTVGIVKGSYVYINGERFWRFSTDGRHRNKDHYNRFAMKPDDASVYIRSMKPRQKQYGNERPF